MMHKSIYVLCFIIFTRPNLQTPIQPPVLIYLACMLCYMYSIRAYKSFTYIWGTVREDDEMDLCLEVAPGGAGACSAEVSWSVLLQ